MHLLKILKPYIELHIINYHNYSRYLFAYIARSLSTIVKLDVLIFHYSFIEKAFSSQALSDLLTTGIIYYKEHCRTDELSLVLKSNLNSESEGSLSLLLKINNVDHSVLSFTFVPSRAFDNSNETAIYISRLQRLHKDKYEIIEEIMDFKGLFPATILMKALEALAKNLNIKKCFGITAANQLSFKKSKDYLKYHATYDEFWIVNGGHLVADSYSFPLPMYQKDILSIKQTHRNRTRRKRRSLSTFYNICDENLSEYFPVR